MLTKVSYIRVRHVDKVFNTIKVIVNKILLGWRLTLQFRYIGKDLFQRYPVLIVFQSHFISSVINITKVFKYYWHSKFLLHNVRVLWMQHLTGILS